MPLGHDICHAQTRRLLGYSSVGRARSRPWKIGGREVDDRQCRIRHGSPHPTAAYLRKVRAAGGIKKYERAHLNAFTASFAPKFSHLLPPELVRRVVEYAFHVGDY